VQGVDYCSTLDQLQLANETLQTENKRLMSEMDELRTQVDNVHCVQKTTLTLLFFLTNSEKN